MGIGSESNFLSIGGPSEIQILARRSCEPPDVGTVGIHHVDLPISIAVGGKGYLPAIGRPGGKQTVLALSRSVREALLMGTVRVHDVDLRVAITV